MKSSYVLGYLIILTILMLKLCWPVFHITRKTFRFNAILKNKMPQQDAEEMKIISEFKKMVPPLSSDLYKGQMGRVGVIGGSEEYTGGPYFAAISMLKLGADISHVFTTQSAAPVIKSYSPELIVHPLLDKENGVEEIKQWLPRLHAIVIGPGLGRLESTLLKAKELLQAIRDLNLPVVIDADGMYLIERDPGLIKGYSNAIITPNRNEFIRLSKALDITINQSAKPDLNSIISETLAVSKKLENVTIVRKSLKDVIVKNNEVMVVQKQGSWRRCGGQGDLLSGAAGLFSFWSRKSLTTTLYDKSMLSAYAACYITKECAAKAFNKHGRSVTTTDLISEIHAVFDAQFEHK